MEKVIKIGGVDVKLSNNMAWTLEYKEQFNKDILPVIMPLINTVIEGLASFISETGGGEVNAVKIADAIEGRAAEVLLPLYTAEFTELVIGVTWAMAKAADDSIDPPAQWIRQFETFPVDVIIPTVYGMALRGLVSSKNLKRLRSIMPSLTTPQPLRQTKSSSLQSNED